MIPDEEALTTILIDDAPLFSEQLRNELERAGCTVLCPVDYGVSAQGQGSPDTFFAEVLLPSLPKHTEKPSDYAFLINANLRLGESGRRSEQLGIEILKHIRLTPELGALCKSHVVLYSFETPFQLLKRKPNNLILCSPGVTFVRLPDGLAQLLGMHVRDDNVDRKPTRILGPTEPGRGQDASRSRGDRLLNKHQAPRALPWEQKDEESAPPAEDNSVALQNPAEKSPAQVLDGLKLQTAEVGAVDFAQFVRPDAQFPADRAYVHSYLNRAGVPKFLMEFAGTIIDTSHPLTTEFNKLARTELQWKEIAFLHPEVTVGAAPEPSEAAEFAAVARAHSYIYIDDEHSRGWSLGLYSGLFGSTLTDEAYSQLCNSEIGHTPDGTFVAMRSPNAAADFLKSRRANVNEALGKWAELTASFSKVTNDKTNAQRQLRQAEVRLNELNREYSMATAAVEARTEGEKKAYQSLWEAARAFSSVAGNLHLEIETDPNQKGDAAIELLESNRSSILTLTKCLSTYSQARSDREGAHDKQQKSQEALAKQSAIISELGSAFAQAQKRFDELRRLVQEAEDGLSRIFPFSMAFLDLRLDPAVDEAVSIEAMSGVRVFRTLKETFPHVPVLILTASQQAISAETVRRLGADGYWIKGMDTGNRLRTIIKGSLPKARLRIPWVRIQQVKAKLVLECWMWDDMNGRFDALDLEKNRSERQLLEQLLEDSFWQIWRNSCSNVSSEQFSDPSFNDVFRILGVAQEIYYNHAYVHTDQIKLWQHVPSEDRAFHSRRNDVCHPRGSQKPVTIEETLSFLNRMLDLLVPKP